MKTKSAGDGYSKKAIEKTVLRFLGSRTFSHDLGHEDQFPPPSLRDRCGFREGTFGGTRANGRDAPIPDVAAVVREGRVRSAAAIGVPLISPDGNRTGSNKIIEGNANCVPGRHQQATVSAAVASASPPGRAEPDLPYCEARERTLLREAFPAVDDELRNVE